MLSPLQYALRAARSRTTVSSSSAMFRKLRLLRREHDHEDFTQRHKQDKQGDETLSIIPERIMQVDNHLFVEDNGLSSGHVPLP